jgi:hypothetical protein
MILKLVGIKIYMGKINSIQGWWCTMGKWADFGISKVSYDTGGTRITGAEVRADPGGRIGTSQVWRREDVVTAFARGRTFVTIMEAPGGGWARGREVYFVQGHECYLITTYVDEKAMDDLGNLPCL